MRYTVLDGGKRIRPTLVYASGQAAGVYFRTLKNAAVSLFKGEQ